MIRLGINISVEEDLEVEKLLKAEDSAKGNSEADILYTQNKMMDANKPEEVEEEPVDEGSEDTNVDQSTVSEDTEPADTGTDTVDEESDPEESPEADTDTEKDAADKASAATEAYSSIGYDFGLEEDVNKTASTLAPQQVITNLSKIGVTLGTDVLTKLRKGLVYYMGRITNLLLNSDRLLNYYIEHRVSTLTKLKTDILAIRKTITDTNSDSDQTGIKAQFTKERVINTLKIGDSVDMTANVSKLLAFNQLIVRNVSAQVSSDIKAVSKIVSTFNDSGSDIDLSTIIDNPIVNGLAVDTKKSQTTDIYWYKDVLPGDTVLLIQLPKKNITDLDGFKQAILNSNTKLGYKQDNFKNIDTIDYMPIAELTKFLDVLEQLCDQCLSHNAVFNEILTNKRKLVLLLKGYFTNLSQVKSKITIKDTLISLVDIKVTTMDKIHIRTLLLMQDYNTKVITNGIALAKDTVSQL